MSKWITIVGEHTYKPRLNDPVPRGAYLEGGPPEAAVGEVTDEMRDRLLYERGEGPQKPDGKPEPIGGPRERTTFRPVPRPPKIEWMRGEDK